MSEDLMDLIVQRDGIIMQRKILDRQLRNLETQITELSPETPPWMKIEEITKRHENL